VKIITGNDLKSGAVTWWDGKGWSLSVNDAVEVDADAAAIIAEEEAIRRVNGAYTIEAAQTVEGIRPAHIKERIRALGGPTVRLDLSLDPSATPDRVL
jgi:hypothetical protein